MNGIRFPRLGRRAEKEVQATEAITYVRAGTGHEIECCCLKCEAEVQRASKALRITSILPHPESTVCTAPDCPQCSTRYTAKEQ